MPTPAVDTQDQRPFVLLRPHVYFRITGCVLLFIALVDLLSFLTGTPIAQPPGVRFDWTHEALITTLGIAALVAGFGRWPRRALATAALAFGVFYALLGIAGFLSLALFGLAPALGLLLDSPDNVSHVVLGGWGVLVGFLGKR